MKRYLNLSNLLLLLTIMICNLSIFAYADEGPDNVRIWEPIPIRDITLQDHSGEEDKIENLLKRKIVNRMIKERTLTRRGVNTKLKGNSGGRINTSPGSFKNMSMEKRIQLIFGSSKRPRTSSDVSKSTTATWVTSITVPVWTMEGGVKTSRTTKITVHKNVAEDLDIIFNKIHQDQSKPVIINGGSYKYRTINNGTGTSSLSNHSFGLALDLNVTNNPYINLKTGKEIQGRKANYQPKNNPLSFHKEHPVVVIFESHGWKWGGDYGDYMHFEFL